MFIRAARNVEADMSSGTLIDEVADETGFDTGVGGVIFFGIIFLIADDRTGVVVAAFVIEGVDVGAEIKTAGMYDVVVLFKQQ